ncbi:MAG: EamA family transporter [Candidatus Cloacimonetes bacterium]|nr:EamA family transporter [Candidatus Cloacimonadota bacterium]
MKNWFIYLKASLAMLFWSFTFIWIKQALITYHPYQIVFMRLVLATVLLFAVIFIFRKREKMEPKDLRYMMMVAFFEPFCYFLGEANGMQFVSPTLGSLIVSTIPLVTALGAWVFLKEKITPLLILGLIISFGGVAVISMAEPEFSGTLKGILLLLVAVFSGMFYAITVRRVTLKYSSLTIVAWQSFFGMIYMLPIFLVFDLKHFSSCQHNWGSMLPVIAMSLFATVGAFLLYTGVIRDIGTVRANIFTNLIPVFTIFLAWIFLDDKITLITVGGVLLTVLGLLLSQLPELKRKLVRGPMDNVPPHGT